MQTLLSRMTMNGAPTRRLAFTSRLGAAVVVMSCWGASLVSPVMAGEQPDTATDDAEFQPLFPEDGVPTGWSVHHWADVSQPPSEPTSWEVRDGVLHGSPLRGTWLISDKQYGDFELRFEFRLGPLGNSGCALRTPAAGDPAFDGLELQMADLRYNTEAKPSELTGGLYRALAPKQQVYRPTEWNSYRIKLIGSHITVDLNGTRILDHDLQEQTEQVPRHDGTLASPLSARPRQGHIGFQELSRGEERVQIRQAQIRELPSATP